MPAFLKRHWFLLLLASVLLVGMTFSSPLATASAQVPKNTVVAVVLLLMALPLESDAMWNTVRRPGPAVLGVTINSLVIPLVAWPLSRLLSEGLSTGVLVAAAVPCTIASATVWTRLAGGNEAVSLMVTVVTNLACFLVTPAWIALQVGSGAHTPPFGEMATRLALIVLLPIVLAQTLRRIPLVAEFARYRKVLLNIMAQVGLLAIVFVGAVYSGEKLYSLEGELAGVAGSMLLMLLLVAAIHTFAWGLGLATGRALGFSRGDSLAVAFAGSQKTLMVGLAIALEFGGLTILPMLAYHVEQLLIDTLLADRCHAQALHTEPAPD